MLSVWRWLHRNHLTILSMHGVAAYGRTPGLEPTRPQLPDLELDRQLAILSEKYRFVSLDEVGGVLKYGKGRGKPCCLVTIDDGYRSAWEIAWPILRRHGVPAVVFVTTEQMRSGKSFWWDQLDYVFLSLSSEVREIELGHHRLPVDLTDRSGRSRSARFVTRESRKLFGHENQRFDAIKRFLDENYDPNWEEKMSAWVGVMSENQVREAAQEGLEIGSHTVHHRRLGDLDRDDVRFELTHSKSEIERVTGVACRAFCFPEGSMNDVSREEVESAGYELGFTSLTGLNAVSSDRLCLRRIHLPLGGSAAYLLAHVSGLTIAVSELKQALRRLFS